MRSIADGLSAMAGADGAALLTRVELFDAAEFTRALGELVANDLRMALVVFLGAEWAREADGPKKITVRRTLNLQVIVSDRAFAEPRAAVFGSDECLGVLALAETVLPLLTTRLFSDADAVELVPTGVTLLDLSADDTQPGRRAAAITLQARGGVLQAETARHPIR